MTALVLLLIPAGTSHAHVRSSTGYSDVRGEGSTVRYELSLETVALDGAAGNGRRRHVLPLARSSSTGSNARARRSVPALPRRRPRPRGAC